MSKPPLTDEEGEVRELTLEDFKHMRPLAETAPGLIEAMQRMKNKGGRPKIETPKVHVGFRMAADVVDGIKETGKGYNARVEKVLRDALARGELNADRELFGGGQGGPGDETDGRITTRPGDDKANR